MLSVAVDSKSQESLQAGLALAQTRGVSDSALAREARELLAELQTAARRAAAERTRATANLEAALQSRDIGLLESTLRAGRVATVPAGLVARAEARVEELEAAEAARRVAEERARIAAAEREQAQTAAAQRLRAATDAASDAEELARAIEAGREVGLEQRHGGGHALWMAQQTLERLELEAARAEEERACLP